jgi:hypothetical protein
MLRAARSLLVCSLLLNLLGQQTAVHVHDSDGGAHGGLGELFHRAAPANRHRCEGLIPHWHPPSVNASDECFLCSVLGDDRATPVTPALSLAPLSDPDATPAPVWSEPRSRRDRGPSAARAPPAA